VLDRIRTRACASVYCMCHGEHLCMQVCHANPSERARFIRCIYNLLNSSSPAVRYEAAGTLVTLSSAPTAIKVHNYVLQFVCVLDDRVSCY